MRIAYRNKSLNADKIKLLEEIGFRFKAPIYRFKWWNNFDRLSQYLSKHDGRIPTVNDPDPEHKKIRRWVLEQRGKMRRGELSDEQVQRWTQVADQVERACSRDELVAKVIPIWYSYLARLAQYLRTHDGSIPPVHAQDPEHKKIRRWALIQRKMMHRGDLSGDKVQHWTQVRDQVEKAYSGEEPASSNTDGDPPSWDTMYNKLVAYQHERQRRAMALGLKLRSCCSVPARFKSERYGNLGEWTMRMICQFNGIGTTKKLTDDRVSKVSQNELTLNDLTPKYI